MSTSETILSQTRTATARLPWGDAHRLILEHGAAAGDNALGRLADFEDRLDYRAAVWWGRVYLAISRISDGKPKARPGLCPGPTKGRSPLETH